MEKNYLRTTYKMAMAASLSISLVAPSLLRAQDEFPPPPPMNDDDLGMGLGNGLESVSSVRNSDPSKKTSPQVLSKNKQSKLSQSALEDITNENFPETIESFDFPNVEITDIIKAVSELTGKNFIIDPGVRGKITIIAPSKITVAEAYKAFLSALAINGFTVVPSGSFLKVKTSRNAQRDSIETFSGAYFPNSDQMITRIIHLKHISAEQVNRDLRILPSKDGEISVYTATNSIIISDYGSNIDRVMKILSQLDVPGFEEQLEVIPIKFGKAKDLAELIDKIVNKGQKNNAGGPGTFTSGVPRFSRSSGTSAQNGASYYMALPDDRTNTIIAVGNKSGIQRVKKLITQLDFRIKPEDAGGIYVYYVKYGEADKIAQVLTGVAKDAGPKTGGATGGFGSNPFPTPAFGAPMGSSNSGSGGGGELFGGDVKIQADKNTNSLVITASKQDYELLLNNILSKIDIPRDQVFVEAVIMEMNMTDSNSWGSGYYQYGDSGFGRGGYNTGVDVVSIANPIPTASTQPLILPFSSGKNVTVKDATGKDVIVPSLIAFFQLLTTNKKTNILSTPQILALDNQEAEIEVGDRVATGISTQTTSGGNSTSTPNFENATIKLNIKPFISPGSNSIRMEVKQEVKQPNNNLKLPKAIADNSLPLSSRSIKTQIVLNSGDTAILGGLIRESETETINKVPLLGDLPIIGWLFKGRDTSKDKVNMLVFLTPKVIRTNVDHRAIVSGRLDERLEFIKGSGGADPFGKKIDEIQKRLSATPASPDVPSPKKNESDLSL